MKYLSVFAVLILSSVFVVAFKEKRASMTYSAKLDGSALFTTHCASCHGLETPAGTMRLAPPVTMVKSHYESSYPEKKEFIKHVSNWVVAPDEEHTLMPGAVRKFKVMPPLALKKNELKAIASYMYNTSFGEAICDEENCEHAGEKGCQQKCQADCDHERGEQHGKHKKRGHQ